MVELTKHQQEQMDTIIEAIDYGNESPVTLAGAAGTGKTTCMGILAGRWPKVLFLAPTNRAALVLRSKLQQGARVSTIHSACMRVKRETHEQEIKLLRALVRQAEDLEVLAEGIGKATEEKKARAEVLKGLVGIDLDAPDKIVRQKLVRMLRQAERDNEIIFEGASEKDEETVSHIVIDEASMVTNEMVEHVEAKFATIPILLVGDDHQLEPVISDQERGKGIVPAMTGEPTARLDEVMRQAEGSRILRFATWIRKQKTALKLVRFADKGEADEQLRITRRPKSGITKGLLRQLDEIIGPQFSGVVLSRRNDTRRTINRGLRQLRGWDEGEPKWLPADGERLVCVTAPSRRALEEEQAIDPIEGEAVAWDSPLNRVVKGTIVFVESTQMVGDARGYQFVRLAARVEGEETVFTAHVAAGEFLRTYQLDEGRDYGFSPRGWYGFDYGMAMSVHKAQGSEFDNVAVYEQAAPWQPDENGKWLRPSREEHRKWAYTAATRAKEKLLWVSMPL